MYTLHRIFCATPWELEQERRVFYDVIGQFNEAEAMGRGVLYVPVTLGNIRDKRPIQYVVDENIRGCRHYVLAVCDGWGPPEFNFEQDYRLAIECSNNPSFPMREVAVLRLKGRTGPTTPEGLPMPDAEFSSGEEFRTQVRELLQRWLVALPS